MDENTGRADRAIDYPVAIVAGVRTPFVKSRTVLRDVSALELARVAVTGLIDRYAVDPSTVESLAFGVVVPEPGRPNLAREIVLESGLPPAIEAQTISSYCITGLRAVSCIADAIATGRISAGIAGGVESLSRADLDTFREPSTGLSMGQHMEVTCKEWNLDRKRQDEIALASHRNAVQARDRLAAEIVPVGDIGHDTGPRTGTSLEALSALKPVFDPDGTITAGNASPVTDGASAVLLMSLKRAQAECRQPLAIIRDMQYGAIDPREGLLMAPALVVPRLLRRNGLSIEQIDLVEIHEAFAAQVLANVLAWEQGWKGAPTGRVDWSRVNTLGGSIAIGHPWSATGGRLLTTLASEMSRRDARLGLVSVCAAGAMAGAMLLQR
jgi:acetyl-CoA acetyltransferase family protein